MDLLLDLSSAVPMAGFIVGAVLCVVALALVNAERTAVLGLGRLLGFLLGFLGVLCLLIATVAKVKTRLALAASIASVSRPWSLEQVRSLSWQQFEQLIADLFRRDGMVVEERGRAAQSTGQGDGGVDLVLSDPNTPGAHYLVQCKQYLAWDVGEPKVREFYGAMAAWRTRCEGILVTCGRFTQPARDFAADKPIRLVDGEGLLRWLNRVNPLAPDADLAAPATVRAVSHAAPVSSQHLPTETSPHCPRCGQPMVQRIARRGARQGQAFWGCRSYPRCNGIINIDG